MIGAIAGGPVGAAVGAGVGAAFGVGAVVIERGKHIRLNKNQQLRIKTAYETKSDKLFNNYQFNFDNL